MPDDSVPTLCKRCKRNIAAKSRFCEFCGQDQLAWLDKDTAGQPTQIVVKKEYSGCLSALGLGSGLAVGIGCIGPLVALLIAIVLFAGCLAALTNTKPAPEAPPATPISR